MNVGINPNLGSQRPGALSPPETQPAGDEGVDLLEHVGSAPLGHEPVGEDGLRRPGTVKSNAAGSAENSSGTSSRSRIDPRAPARVFDHELDILGLVERTDPAHVPLHPQPVRRRPGWPGR